MKKPILSILAFVAAGSVALAQDTFTPGWFLEAKAGAAYTAGKAQNFGALVSPTGAISFGYDFVPGFSLRGDIAGWQGKGALVSEVGSGVSYKFNYAQLGVDAMWDICNTFNYKWSRVVNPYIFAGPGLNVRFNNKEAQQYASAFPTPNNLWKSGVLALIGRAGVGVVFRCSDLVGINFEVVDNFCSDGFNSLADHKVDQHLTALVGVKFSFGRKSVAPAPAPVATAADAAEATAAREAAEEAPAEPVAPAAPVVEEPAPVVAPVEEKPVEEPKVDNSAERASSQTLYYKSQHRDVDETHAAAIQAVVDKLNRYPEAVVTVTGYADKATGTADYNLKVSQKRAENVAKALTEAGIAQERIEVKWVGDTESISEVSKENRAVVCVTK